MKSEHLGFASILAMALTLGAACGDSDEGSRFGDAGPSLFPDAEMPASPVAVTITAANGGEISNGTATLDIPADALAENTEITIEPVAKAGLPDEDTIASEVFDFGPDGTTFEAPVTLTFEFDASAAPEGMAGTIAYLDGDAWVPLEDSRVSGDTVTATTDHFTYFAVVWTADGGSQSAGMCEAFTPCGGDLVGTWTVSLGCITLPPNLLGDPNDPQNPFAGCEGIESTGDVEITGTVTFADDDTYETDLTFAVDIATRIPASCIPDGATCMDFQGTEDGDFCVTGMPSTSSEMGAGTYAVDGNTFTTTSTGGQADTPVEFCVEGTTLTVRSPGTDSSPEIGYVAEKQ